MLFTGLDRSVLGETVHSVWVLLAQDLRQSFSQNGPPSQWITYIYYLHTEKYSPKSYVIHFHTQMNSIQSDEWTMVFTCEENDTSNKNRKQCFFFFFFTYEKNDMSNQKTLKCVSLVPKFTPFKGACSLQHLLQHRFAVFQWEKFFSKSFSHKKVKSISEIGVEWFCLLHFRWRKL